ncbi:MAG: Transcriptional regulator, PadR family [uncultured Rubrobacteraceae bacterium]|uniref:Transcriptional regulator, PadR family n=1 Tax=uncultured Rubrobacteraceae bacterium TaxID=349277 RepID=A0A6J4QRG7_9ACTN|nr:MAG: Transcriptional regulator, PadR family [uncultured Rubrobacteraceae bacterium]
MPDEERERHGGENRPGGINRIEVRPRNWLVPVILLSLRESTSYGYKLMEQATVFGFEAMNPGTLYRTLRNMEKDGVVESEWDTINGGGPARRVYSITNAGEAYLNFWAKSLEQYQRNMDAFFSLYTGGRPPTRGDQQKDER